MLIDSPSTETHPCHGPEGSGPPVHFAFSAPARPVLCGSPSMSSQPQIYQTKGLKKQIGPAVPKGYLQYCRDRGAHPLTSGTPPLLGLLVYIHAIRFLATPPGRTASDPVRPRPPDRPRRSSARPTAPRAPHIAASTSPATCGARPGREHVARALQLNRMRINGDSFRRVN